MLFLPLPLPALHDSSDSVSDDNASLLCLFLRETSCDANLQSRLRLPLLFELFRCQTECTWHGLQSCDKDAVVQALWAS